VSALVTTPANSAAKSRSDARASDGSRFALRSRSESLAFSINARRTLGRYARKGCDVLRKKNLQAILLCAMALVPFMAGQPAAASTTYKITEGDNLWLIARRHSTHIVDIKKANPKLNFDKPLKLGATLIIPVDSPPKSHKISANKIDNSRVAIKHRKALAAKLAKQKAEKQRKMAAARKAKHLAALKHKQLLLAKAQHHKVAKVGHGKKMAVASLADDYRSRIVRRALSYRGARYRSGGTGRSGFDCSGFTRHIFMKSGVALPHSSSAQAHVGSAVPKSNLRKGDLVFFHTYRRGISHVGVYIGNGKFVHASNHFGGVKTDSLSSDYYRSRYRCARRVK
jgi:cell wall-associated NlpC family hydrolase